MFRCPHCGERTIGVWAKLKANGLRPGACPACGGKYVPVVWTTLPVLALLLGGLFAPFMAGAIFYPLVVSVLVPGVLGACLVQLVTPLLRHGSRAGRGEWWTLAATIVLIVAYAFFALFPVESGDVADSPEPTSQDSPT
jgi:hypothetical protein